MWFEVHALEHIQSFNKGSSHHILTSLEVFERSQYTFGSSFVQALKCVLSNSTPASCSGVNELSLQ